jgi:hypothetical protein
MSDNVWYHVVAVWNGTHNIVYLNGVAGTAVANTPSFSANAYDLHIGRWNSNNAYAFNGSIDEVKIYNRALSASQIQQSYLVSLPRHQE